MKNSDKPAYPSTNQFQLDVEKKVGLSKREIFAMAAMQGIMANPAYNDINPITIAMEAINQADELLKQLDTNP